VVIEENSEQFINDIYIKAKEYNILRNIIPKEEYLKKMIKSNTEAIEKSKERIEFVDPREQQKLKSDIEMLENDNLELINQLKKLQK